MSKPVEDPLVAQAFDADKHVELARAIEKLSSEEAAFFLEKLEAAIRKRKIQITGYLASMLAWVLGMFGALVYYGTHDGFVGWVFLVPFLFVGLMLFAFGRWAEKVGGKASEATATRTTAPGTSPRPG